jgi:hypothetical protein
MVFSVYTMNSIPLFTLYFKDYNHEVFDGKQPTESKENEDKWGYTGCIEMIKTGRGASFAWPHLRYAKTIYLWPILLKKP